MDELERPSIEQSLAAFDKWAATSNGDPDLLQKARDTIAQGRRDFSEDGTATEYIRLSGDRIAQIRYSLAEWWEKCVCLPRKM